MLEESGVIINNIKIGDIVEWGTAQSNLIGFVVDINIGRASTTICWFKYGPKQYGIGALKTFKKVD